MKSERLTDLLKGNSSGLDRILIAGASGWIGRETISLFQPVFGEDFSKRVTLAGSRDGFSTVNGVEHRIRKLSGIQSDETFDFVINLAFLTQDKARSMGTAEYSRVNREISNFVFQVCRYSEAKYVLLASSGAADPDFLASCKDPSKRLYGQLKNEAEELFLNLKVDNDSSVEIGRIWSISGAQIQEPLKYALGDFIIQANTTGNIEMNSGGVVERAYVDAGEVMAVFILNLLKGGTGLLDSGGFRTSLQDLARLVLKELRPEGNLIVPRESAVTDDDIYLPNLAPFNSLATSIGVNLSSLEEQIRTTARGQSFR